MRVRGHVQHLGIGWLVGLTILGASTAEAGGPVVVRGPAVVVPTGQAAVPTARVVVIPAARLQDPAAAPYPMLGTFYPTPTMFVRGNAPVGGGYTPPTADRNETMALYGPLSPLRSITAPVRYYTRGYNGVTYQVEGAGTSNPFLPTNSPVIYPTRASYYYGFRRSGTPPWWDRGDNWVDQN